jgi:hypothetical protein
MPPRGIRTHNLSRQAAEDLRLGPRGHWDRQLSVLFCKYLAVGLLQSKTHIVCYYDGFICAFVVYLPKPLVAPALPSCLERHRELCVYGIFDELVDNFTRWFLGWLLDDDDDDDDVEMMRELRGCGLISGTTSELVWWCEQNRATPQPVHDVNKSISEIRTSEIRSVNTERSMCCYVHFKGNLLNVLSQRKMFPAVAYGQ